MWVYFKAQVVLRYATIASLAELTLNCSCPCCGCDRHHSHVVNRSFSCIRTSDSRKCIAISLWTGYPLVYLRKRNTHTYRKLHEAALLFTERQQETAEIKRVLYVLDQKASWGWWSQTAPSYTRWEAPENDLPWILCLQNHEKVVRSTRFLGEVRTETSMFYAVPSLPRNVVFPEYSRGIGENNNQENAEDWMISMLFFEYSYKQAV